MDMKAFRENLQILPLCNLRGVCKALEVKFEGKHTPGSWMSSLCRVTQFAL